MNSVADNVTIYQSYIAFLKKNNYENNIEPGRMWNAYADLVLICS